MLKNVHLAPGWLMQLEKKLHSLQPHACFRLFLTMEINPKVSRVGASGVSVCTSSGLYPNQWVWSHACNLRMIAAGLKSAAPVPPK